MLKKLSLAAIIAASGVSFASATPLTEAIKNVDLSGMLRIRFYNENPKKATSYNRWRTSSDFKFTVPVSEELKVVAKYGIEGSVYSNSSNLGPKASTVDPSINENFLFLNYSANGVNAILGKIPVATSITGSGHGEAHGAGLIASYKVNDMFTVAGAYVDAVKDVDQVPNKATGLDLYALAGMFNIDMVKGNVWYYTSTKNGIKNIFTISASVSPIENLKVNADYAAGKLDYSGAKVHTYFNIAAKYSMDAFCAKIGYATTNKKGDLVVLDNDSPIAAVIPTANNYAIANKLDTTAVYGKIGYMVDPKTSVYFAAQYQNAGKNSGNAKNDLNEYTIGAKYKYNKKLGFNVYYDIADWKKGADNLDNNEFRFEAKYTF